MSCSIRMRKWTIWQTQCIRLRLPTIWTTYDNHSLIPRRTLRRGGRCHPPQELSSPSSHPQPCLATKPDRFLNLLHFIYLLCYVVFQSFHVVPTVILMLFSFSLLLLCTSLLWESTVQYFWNTLIRRCNAFCVEDRMDGRLRWWAVMKLTSDASLPTGGWMGSRCTGLLSLWKHTSDMWIFDEWATLVSRRRVTQICGERLRMHDGLGAKAPE